MQQNTAHLSRFDAPLGASEARTEPYATYGEGALELATTRGAKSTGKPGGFASEVAGATRKMS